MRFLEINEILFVIHTFEFQTRDGDKLDVNACMHVLNQKNN